MPTRPLIAVALLAILAALPGTAEAAVEDCRKKRKVLASNSAVTVFWGPRDVDDGRALCASYRKRRPLVLSYTSLDYGPDSWHLAGRFVFVVDRLYDRGTGDSMAFGLLTNVLKRRTIHRWSFSAWNGQGSIGFPVVRLLRSGSLAFSVESAESDAHPGGPQSEIHRAMGSYQDTLAAGPEVDAHSLHFSRETMHWTTAGRPFSADFF